MNLLVRHIQKYVAKLVQVMKSKHNSVQVPPLTINICIFFLGIGLVLLVGCIGYGVVPSQICENIN